MSDSSRRDARLDRDLEDLSALLDGELEPGREAELRRRMTERPELAEALALLGEADQQLRALADQPVPDDALARMRAGFDAKLAAAEAGPLGGATLIAFPLRRRWMAAAAAALAAGLALYLGAGRSPAPAPETASDPEQLAEMPAPAEERRALEDEELAPAAALAEASPVELAPAIPEPVAPAQAAEQPAASTRGTELAALPAIPPEPDPEAAAGEALLDAASEEEIAIAIDYETLSDFDVIAQLDLLELLDALDAVEEM